MFNLVLKDILIQRKTAFFPLVYAIVFIFMFQSTGNPAMIFVAIPSVVAYMLLMYACGYDDKNKSEMVFNSLPIKRKDIVIAKYLSTVVFVLIGLAIAIGFTTILKFSGYAKFNRFMGIEDIIGVIASVTILSSIYFPIYFKLGYLKSRYINTAFLLAAFFIPSMLGDFIAEKQTSKFVVYLNSQPDWVLGSLILFIAIIAVAVSIYVSIKIYMNKDL